MRTFNGGMAPYATPTDFIARVDYNTPGLLTQDNDTQASPNLNF